MLANKACVFTLWTVSKARVSIYFGHNSNLSVCLNFESSHQFKYRLRDGFNSQTITIDQI